MIFTVEEAKQLFCCNAMNHPTEAIKCMASDCMAWRWNTRLEIVIDGVCQNCANEVKDCICSKEDKEDYRLFMARHGYCALTGKPE